MRKADIDIIGLALDERVRVRKEIHVDVIPFGKWIFNTIRSSDLLGHSGIENQLRPPGHDIRRAEITPLEEPHTSRKRDQVHTPVGKHDL